MAIDQTLPNDRVVLSVGYFWTRYRNLILSVFDPTVCTAPRSFGFCAQNAGLARAQGVEASAKFKLVRDRPWIKSLDLQIHYTYTATREFNKWPGYTAAEVAVQSMVNHPKLPTNRRPASQSGGTIRWPDDLTTLGMKDRSRLSSSGICPQVTMSRSRSRPTCVSITCLMRNTKRFFSSELQFALFSEACGSIMICRSNVA